SRRARFAAPLFDFELSFDLLRSDADVCARRWMLWRRRRLSEWSGPAGERLDAVERLSGVDRLRHGARSGRDDRGRLYRAVALPLRRRRTRFRGVHDDAVQARHGAPDGGQAVSAPPPFPTLAGQGWSVHKTPLFSTIVASHVSGREVRDALYQNPIWRFELTFDGLGSDSVSYPGVGAQSLQSPMGFYVQCQGQYGSFLYTDPTDNAV